MILHIHNHNTIFTGLSSEIFQNLDIGGKHLLLHESPTPDSATSEIICKPYGSKAYRDFLHQELAKYSLVLFHGLLGSTLRCLRDILKSPQHPPTAWVIYGAEIEESFIIPSRMLGVRTRCLYYSLLPYRVLVPFYRMSVRLSDHHLTKLLRKVDYFAHFMPEEIDFVQHHIGIRKPMLFHSYTRLDHFIEPELRDHQCKTHGNILIGNSASFTSNHIEIFSTIEPLLSQSTKVVTPLNYGNRYYKNHILRVGNKRFGALFSPITEPLSKKEYHRQMLDCSVFIQNSHKQQALGNIISALWFGLRVYLNDFTSTYKYFKRHGAILYSIGKDLSPENDHRFEGLSENQMLQNRNVLETLFGEQPLNAAMKTDFQPFA